MLTIGSQFTSPLFRSLVDEEELYSLDRLFPDARTFSALLRFTPNAFIGWKTRMMHKANRRGEVSMAILNRQRNLLVHTKSFYPPGVYRIPTGGVDTGESVTQALEREIYEETGIMAQDYSLLGIILYKFTNSVDSLPFISYLFKYDSGEVMPAVQDEQENIIDFRWVDKNQLAILSDQLENLTDGWEQWGQMRAIPHKILLKYFL